MCLRLNVLMPLIFVVVVYFFMNGTIVRRLYNWEDRDIYRDP